MLRIWFLWLCLERYAVVVNPGAICNGSWDYLFKLQGSQKQRFTISSKGISSIVSHCRKVSFLEPYFKVWTQNG